jgi:hypothetical protein
MGRVAIFLAGVAVAVAALPAAATGQDGDDVHVTPTSQSGQVKITGARPTGKFTSRRARRVVRTALVRQGWTVTSLTCTVAGAERASCDVEAVDDAGWAGSGTARVRRGRVTVVRYRFTASNDEGSAPAG